MGLLSGLKIPDKVTHRTIPDGVAGTKATLKIMARVARDGRTDPAVYALSRKVVSEVPGKNWRAEADAIFRFVQRHIRYTRDPKGCEGIQTPRVTLELASGDCDDMTTLLGAMLLSTGHPARAVAVKVGDDAAYSHVFCQTLIGTKWVSMDATEPYPMGWVSPLVIQPALYWTF